MKQQHMDKILIRQRFDRHAFEYDQYAHVQRRMAQWLIDHIPDPLNIGSILEIGCGTGNLTLELRRRYPGAELVVIDLAPAMLAESKKKLGEHAAGMTQTSYMEGDAELIIPELAGERPRSFDLIVSNATFQWFNDPELTAQACLHCLKPEGSFLFSTFAERTFEELKVSFRAAEKALNIEAVPHGQAFYTAQDWQSLFADCGKPFQWSEELHLECYPDTSSFLHAVQRIGASNALQSGGRHTGLAGRTLLKAMQQFYQDHYSIASSIQATYHLGYGIISSRPLSHKGAVNIE